ncbi:MAG TPA: tRNA uridine-5-carboxymethylaminomethyl(34) synthesis enzyme MnmG [Lachnospiraceae bacterium]|nr:tRNA uridine-5-carboxymethylaminomethyl(34) synthesis enzyme MnmG [Lachnospiraceae bacterium]
MAVVEEKYDIVVVGAGHAGCEAALAAARLGFETILFTVSMDSVALMPCNPNIGGSSKGHLVREIDALGGEMGKNIDKTYIQSKLLNVSKGPAVHSLRAQADKVEYTKQMRLTLQNTEHLTLRQQEVSELIVLPVDSVSSELPVAEKTGIDDQADNTGKIKVVGIKTVSGAIYHARAVILCTGVYLKARCIYGDTIQYTGPNGLMAANHLSDSMAEAGIGIRRFKTGTPPRIDKNSVDFSKMSEQKGDDRIVPFSFMNCEEDIRREQISCWLTYTNEETHEIIRENIDRSPLYSGVIKGTGPRYCPSIEDKIMKFPDKDRHQLFLEPEGEFTNEMYLDGMPSSMPEDVQYRMVHTVPGLENAKIVRNAYAIEYDCINAVNLTPSLEFKDVSGLFSAGQINGSSGYEEAAAQGLMAGINAARLLQGKPPVVLMRSDGYIGVLIDDLVTKETKEPYRMMTSRAEYRLLLRQDNADLRLTAIGHEIGLIDDARYNMFLAKKKFIESEVERLGTITVGASKTVADFLIAHGSTPLNTGNTLAELVRRPELSYNSISELDSGREEAVSELLSSMSDEERQYCERHKREITEQIDISIKYEGYIRRQEEQVSQFLKMEGRKIPADIDYDEVRNLRREARQKLKDVKPETLGQASRISGVSPADVSMLMLFLKSK